MEKIYSKRKLKFFSRYSYISSNDFNYFSTNIWNSYLTMSKKKFFFTLKKITSFRVWNCLCKQLNPQLLVMKTQKNYLLSRSNGLAILAVTFLAYTQNTTQPEVIANFLFDFIILFAAKSFIFNSYARTETTRVEK